MSEHIQVLATGGTIASTKEKGEVRPTEAGTDVVDRLVELDEFTDITVRSIAQTASSDMTFETIVRVAEEAREAAMEGSDGVVVMHGTSTMEESAYYLDVCLDLDVPILFTGAQRRPDQPSSDGAANFRDAVQTATAPEFHPDDGVYVVLNNEIHHARDVTKIHSFKLDGFESPAAGPVGTIRPKGITLHREPGSRSATIPVVRSSKRVEIVRSGVSVDATPIERALNADVDGIIVEGTGLGNTTAKLADGIVKAVEMGVPVVVTTRCPAGGVAPVYGYRGGNKMLVDNGAINAGDLSTQKARIKLRLALEAVERPMAVEQYFP
jgi:L-asparaginase